MKTQPVEPVMASTQAKQVSILCPGCRTQKTTDMATFWPNQGRNRSTAERCGECTANARLGIWLRGKDEKERTISDWLSGIQCLHAMHVDICNCETAQEVDAVQSHMQKKRESDSSLPSLHETKRQRCDAGETSAELP